MNKGFIFLAFVLGAAGGSFATYKLLKNKYEEIAQEEIDSVTDVYSKNYGNDEEDIEDIPEEIRQQLEFVPVEHLDKVLETALLQ